jgi:hypothetical protein
MRKTTGVLVGVAAVLLAAGCGGSSSGAKAAATGSPTPEASPSASSSAATPPSPSSDPKNAAVLTYLKALADPHPATNAHALAVAEPGSPAAEYVNYLTFNDQALQDANQPIENQYYSQVSDGTYQLCDQSSGQAASCITLSNFTFAPDGKISSLSTAGQSLSSRLAPGGATASSNGLVVTAQRAYRSGQDQPSLNIQTLIDNTSNQQMTVLDSSSTYSGPDGITKAVSAMVGVVTLQPGAKGRYVFSVTDGTAPGQLTLSVNSLPSGQDFTLSVKVG